MFRRALVPLVCGIALVQPLGSRCAGATPPEQLAELKAEAIAAAVERVEGALVQLRIIGEFRGLSRTAAGVGTGVLVDRQWVITSRFGLEQRPDVLLVLLPGGERRSAKVAAFDLGRNLALLRLAEPVSFDPADLEARSDPEPGETAVALGAAYSADECSVTVGIVSATGRFLGRAVQTDAATSPANYGGLLIDLKGRVLGITTPLGDQQGQLGVRLYDSGIGFAIPLHQVRDRLERLCSGEELSPGRIGVRFRAGNPFASPAVIARVSPEGPAAEAGIEPSETVVAVGETPVGSVKQFELAMGPYDAGDEVAITVRADGADARPREVTLRLVKANKLALPAEDAPNLLERLKLDVPQAD